MKRVFLLLPLIFLVGCSSQPKVVEQAPVKEFTEVKRVEKEEVKEIKYETLEGVWRTKGVKLNNKEYDLKLLEEKLPKESFEKLKVELTFSDKEIIYNVNGNYEGTTGYKEIEERKWKDFTNQFEFTMVGELLEAKSGDTIIIFEKVKQ